MVAKFLLLGLVSAFLMAGAQADTSGTNAPASLVGTWGIAQNWLRCRDGYPAPSFKPTITLNKDGSWNSVPPYPPSKSQFFRWSGSADGSTFMFEESGLWGRFLHRDPDGIFRGHTGDNKGCLTAVYLGR